MIDWIGLLFIFLLFIIIVVMIIKGFVDFSGYFLNYGMINVYYFNLSGFL